MDEGAAKGGVVIDGSGIAETSQRIQLSLTEHYAPSWKTWEGVRELTQNWHDGVLQALDSLPLEHQLALLKEEQPMYQATKGLSFEKHSGNKSIFSLHSTNTTIRWSFIL